MNRWMDAAAAATATAAAVAVVVGATAAPYRENSWVETTSPIGSASSHRSGSARTLLLC